MRIDKFYPDYKKRDCTPGPLLISGAKEKGADRFFIEALKLALADEAPICLGYERMSLNTLNIVKNEVSSKGYRLIILNPIKCEGTDFDVLSVAENEEQVANIAYNFIAASSENESDREIILRCLRISALSLKTEGKHVNLKNLFDNRIEDMRYVCEHHPDQLEDLSDIDFLDTSDAYSAWGKINDRANKYRNNGVLSFLSGIREMGRLFTDKTIIMVSYDRNNAASISAFKGMLNGILSAVAMLCEIRSSENKKFHVFLFGCIELTRDLILEILEVGQDAINCIFPVCAYNQSINQLLKKNGSDIMDKINAFVIFGTNDPIDQSYWSDFIGTMPTAERTDTYGKKKRWLTNWFESESTISRRNRQYEGSTIHYVEKVKYEARVFAKLKNNQFMFFSNAVRNKCFKAMLEE